MANNSQWNKPQHFPGVAAMPRWKSRQVDHQTQRTATFLLLLISVALNIWNIRAHFWGRINSILDDVPRDPTSAQANRIRQDFQASSSSSSIPRATSPQGNTASWSGKVRRLEFVHIPKTAGTAIEQAALAQGVEWGYLHFSFDNGKGTRQNSNETVSFRKRYGGFPWHIPPCLLGHQNQKIVSENPYQAKNASNEQVDLFAVVRNPYDRLISEYRYFKLMVRKSKNSGAYQMNQFVQKKLQTVEVALRQKLLQSNDTCHLDSYTTDFFQDKGHYIPQYDYVYATNVATNETAQMIPHVLKYESLQEDFAALMQRYGLQHIQLAESKEHRTLETQPGQQDLTPSHLSPENIRKINQIYRNDFIAFGYDMK